ncbi:MAG: sensor histidine kinase [Janthinobacterium lividum]
MSEVRVLYVDDDDGLRLLTRRALERRGLSVDLAASGAEGVEKAISVRYDVVAIDHYMPGQDGLATLEQVREHAPHSCVVYVTGSEEGRIAVAALKAGAVDYVVKSTGDDYFDLLARAIQQASAGSALRREKEQAEAALRTSNGRLQALLHEVNHRVSNSLQLVTAFVQLQARNLDDGVARSALEDTQRRINAIAQVHRRLYTSSDVQGVAMDEYLRALLAELEETWSTPVSRRELRLFAEPVRMLTDRAVALGVIVNELVSNACKYAYPTGQNGTIRIDLREDGGKLLLGVEDDGCGMPADGTILGTGLGTKLVNSMVTSLGASIGYTDRAPGTRAEIALSM